MLRSNNIHAWYEINLVHSVDEQNDFDSTDWKESKCKWYVREWKLYNEFNLDWESKS